MASTLTTTTLGTYALPIEGIDDAAAQLVGSIGHLRGEELSIEYNSGFTLFDEYSGKVHPQSISQLNVLGKSFTFRVDLRKVGCGCNLALKLVQAPALDDYRRPSRGVDRKGQLAYYCDSNKVGGQWCPEIDLMEANNHAFQATPHKCDPTTTGHYNSCDRGGCGQSTRDRPNSYGMGPQFTIDTTRPFDVQTDFLEAYGVFTGLRTTLRQGRQEVVLDFSNCDTEYMRGLSDPLSSGMALRITYWGEQAETMAWLDSPPCGGEACTRETAGNAILSRLAMTSVDAQVEEEAIKKNSAWVVSDVSDELYGHVVPEQVIENDHKFVSLDGKGIVDWRSSVHMVKRRQQIAAASGATEALMLPTVKKFQSWGTRGSLMHMAVFLHSPGVCLVFGVSLLLALSALVLRRLSKRAAGGTVARSQKEELPASRSAEATAHAGSAASIAIAVTGIPRGASLTQNPSREHLLCLAEAP